MCVRAGGERKRGVQGAKELRGVCVRHIVWLRVEFVKGEQRGKDILRERA